MDTDTRSIVSRLKESLELLYGSRLSRLILYGSQVRGDADRYSDIDVLVVLKGPVKPGDEIARTGGVVADLSLQIDKVITCVFMDEERYLHRAGPLLRNIRREGVAVPSASIRLSSRRLGNTLPAQVESHHTITDI